MCMVMSCVSFRILHSLYYWFLASYLAEKGTTLNVFIYDYLLLTESGADALCVKLQSLVVKWAHSIIVTNCINRLFFFDFVHLLWWFHPYYLGALSYEGYIPRFSATYTFREQVIYSAVIQDIWLFFCVNSLF